MYLEAKSSFSYFLQENMETLECIPCKGNKKRKGSNLLKVLLIDKERTSSSFNNRRQKEITFKPILSKGKRTYGTARFCLNQ
jgi:hypothetical protein